jgi:hypothetical protein
VRNPPVAAAAAARPAVSKLAASRDLKRLAKSAWLVSLFVLWYTGNIGCAAPWRGVAPPSRRSR